MDLSDFSIDESPGKLEKTVFTERFIDGTAIAYRDVDGYGFVPDPLPPASIDHGELLVATQDLLLAAERNLSHLEGLAQQLDNPYLLIGPFANREAKFSSAIENTFASAEQIALFEVDASTVEPSSRQDVLEVRNYVRALHHGFRSELPICRRLILEMHEILLKDVQRVAGIPGQFRTTQNAIGRSTSFANARFVPTPPRFLENCFGAVEKYIHEKDKLPRLIQFALLHYQFECIHPFDDGNGRLGRLLIAVQLCEQAQLSQPLVYVSRFFEQHRTEYYDLLYEVSTRGKWLNWIKFFLLAVVTQAEDAHNRARKLLDLHDDYIARVREKRASPLLPIVIDHLFQSPAVTIARVAEVAKVTPPSAGKLVARLTEKKILVEATGRKKDRVWMAPDIFAVIENE